MTSSGPASLNPGRAGTAPIEAIRSVSSVSIFGYLIDDPCGLAPIIRLAF